MSRRRRGSGARSGVDRRWVVGEPLRIGDAAVVPVARGALQVSGEGGLLWAAGEVTPAAVVVGAAGSVRLFRLQEGRDIPASVLRRAARCASESASSAGPS